MDVTVNGERMSLPEGTTVAALLEKLNAVGTRVAVLLNETVIPSPDQPQRRLEEGDRVEVLTMAGGG